jgi:hypothetical protein
VAKHGFKAVMAGRRRIVSGWQNKLQAAAAHMIPAQRLAQVARNSACVPGIERYSATLHAARANLAISACADRLQSSRGC